MIVGVASEPVLVGGIAARSAIQSMFDKGADDRVVLEIIGILHASPDMPSKAVLHALDATFEHLIPEARSICVNRIWIDHDSRAEWKNQEYSNDPQV